MTRVLLTVEYLGREYCGWQVQDNGVSVQGVLEEAVFKLTGERVRLFCSGRTDSGVHAIGQTAHFDTDTVIPPAKLPFALNTLLPKDIRVKKAVEVPDDFDARFSAHKKTYVYKMYVSPHLSPTRLYTHAHITGKVDIVKMRAAAALISGTHDFKCFQATGGHVKDTVRTIYELKVIKSQDEIRIKVTGNGFLYKMVRNIAGTLVYAGKGKLSLADIEKLLITGDRSMAGATLPPEGLYLVSVDYKGVEKAPADDV